MNTELPYIVLVHDRRDGVCKVNATFLSIHDAKDFFKHLSSHLAAHHTVTLWDREEVVLLKTFEK